MLVELVVVLRVDTDVHLVFLIVFLPVFARSTDYSRRTPFLLFSIVRFELLHLGRLAEESDLLAGDIVTVLECITRVKHFPRIIKGL